ncbi:hypothetical protein EMPG_14071 [Blastomyces silverae]|uniref:Uncharacterized protein n=1 Tax=Blastomyces silverae TaxID=2060906 RepID=A0A0H1BN10_9EURO|nr:hypothetical protein EMPG_14071 [Blastomyces silverae]
MNGPPSINPSRTLPSLLKTHLAQNVTKAHADLILIGTCFISGLVDSAAFNETPSTSDWASQANRTANHTDG